MKVGKSCFVGCYLLCRDLVNSSACIHVVVWDEDCSTAEKRLKLQKLQVQEKS